MRQALINGIKVKFNQSPFFFLHSQHCQSDRDGLLTGWPVSNPSPLYQRQQKP